MKVIGQRGNPCRRSARLGRHLVLSFVVSDLDVVHGSQEPADKLCHLGTVGHLLLGTEELVEVAG